MVDHINLSGYDNANDIFKVAQASNDVTNGYFFPLIFMFAGFMVLFISFKSKYDTIVALIGSSFVTSIIGAGGFTLGLVPKNIVFIPIFMLVGSILYYMVME